MIEITRDTVIEDLIREHPETVRYMIGRGLPCFVCGEPTWGTFEEMARRRGKSDEEIDRMVTEMRALSGAKPP